MVEVDIRPLQRLYFAAVGTLVAAHFTVTFGERTFGPLFYRLFYLDAEGNIPAWFSSCGLLFVSLALAGVSRYAKLEKRGFHRHWCFLSGVFALLSVDELAALHEMSTSWLSTFYLLHRLGGAAWIAPAMILLAALAVGILRLLRALPRAFARRFVVAGGVYLFGAVVIEVIGAHYAKAYGYNSVSYTLLAALEEGGEMIGVGLFLGAVLDYARELKPRLVFGLAARTA